MRALHIPQPFASVAPQRALENARADNVGRAETLARIDDIAYRHSPFTRGTRFVTTVLISDIVDSTSRAASLGDKAWLELLDHELADIRRHLAHHAGREVQALGDGMLAQFATPTAALRCANSIRLGADELGLDVRIGLHCGEVERTHDDFAGITVHIASRIAALAGAGEILVSRTVKDLVMGSGFEFSHRAWRTLRGIPDRWQILSLDDHLNEASATSAA